MPTFEKLFAGERSANGVAYPQFPPSPVDPKLLPLETAVFRAALNASKAIEADWSKVTGQAEMPFWSTWAVRVEELGFMLHIVNRLALMVGGDTLKESLQRYFTLRLVNSLVDNSWDSSNAEPGFARIQHLRSTKQKVLEVINDAEAEYLECRTMLRVPLEIKPGPAATPVESLSPDDTDITGCLVKRIAQGAGQADSPKLRALVWAANLQAVSQQRIVPEVEAAVRAIYD